MPLKVDPRCLLKSAIYEYSRFTSYLWEGTKPGWRLIIFLAKCFARYAVPVDWRLSSWICCDDLSTISLFDIWCTWPYNLEAAVALLEECQTAFQKASETRTYGNRFPFKVSFKRRRLKTETSVLENSLYFLAQALKATFFFPGLKRCHVNSP